MRLISSVVIPSRAQRIVLLAPAYSASMRAFHQVHVDPVRHAVLLRDMQRLRGKVYLNDGAIDRSQLSVDGLHRQDVDEESWHILALDQHGRVSGCVRYRNVPDARFFQQLWIQNASISRSEIWGGWLREVVQSEMIRARRAGLNFVEVGGWAITEDRRCTVEALRLALTTYGLGQTLGGCLGVTTATVRHHSSLFLRRLGGRSLEWDGVTLPPYYDPQYACEMEMLRFDSRLPDLKYGLWAEQIGRALTAASVICRSQERANYMDHVGANPVSIPPAAFVLQCAS